MKTTTAVKDLVCGMDVESATAARRTEYKGKTYCSCGFRCKERFDPNPQRYLGKPVGTAKSDRGTWTASRQQPLAFTTVEGDTPRTVKEKRLRVALFKVIPLAVVAILCCACGRKEFDRQTAMKVLQGRVIEKVECRIRNKYDTRFDPRAVDDYQQLVKSELLACQMDSMYGYCSPGAKMGKSGRVAFYQDPRTTAENATVFGIPIGNLVASAVTGITRTSDNSAIAEVQLAFQPTPAYVEAQAVFDRISLTPIIRRSSAKVFFQRYDYGWRVVSVRSEPLPSGGKPEGLRTVEANLARPLAAPPLPGAERIP